AGPAGQDGQDGKDGTDGRDGQSCPDGYSLQPPPDDPDALVCRKDGAPQPSDSPSTPQALGLDPQRRQYV
ncbi:collagen-like protein, partial [Streptomyces sp. NPDC002920]